MKLNKTNKVLIPIALLIIIIMSLFIFCFTNENANIPVVSSIIHSVFNKKDYTAEELINNMKNDLKNLGEVTVYTIDTDPNKLMGKDGEYTSKISFEDTRLKQSENRDPNGGTIEVFNTVSDAKARYAYIKGISDAMPILKESTYRVDKYLLRTSKDLNANQVKEYEEVFKATIK